MLSCWGQQVLRVERMEKIKQFFDVLDYATFRVFLYALMVIGAYTLIKFAHASPKRNRHD